MKKILILIFCALLCSCTSVRLTHVPKVLTVSGFDYTKYTNKGFLITPYKYEGDYMSIGSISINSIPEANLVEIDTGSKTEDGKKITKEVWVKEKVDVREAIDSLYVQAKKMGADAVVSVSILDYSQIYGQKTRIPVTIYGKVVTGFAIKRTDLDQ